MVCVRCGEEIAIKDWGYCEKCLKELNVALLYGDRMPGEL